MKKNIALLTGGYSSEAKVSYESVKTVQANLDLNLYNVYTIDIRPEGWMYLQNDGTETAIDKNDFSLHLNGEKISFDAAFICIHGTPGEDGKLQGYFDCIGLPYTSCNAATSAITFNKRYTVAVAGFAGIHVARSLHIFRNAQVSPDEIAGQLQLPVFVKPNNGGSSIGMSKVNETGELAAALEKAFAEDDQVLVEEYISGREFTIGVFKTKGEIITLPMTEIITEKEFFDYEAKYLGKSREITPAITAESMAEKIRATAKKIYEVFNCRGVIRIDFIWNEAVGAPFMLEVNTIPGQSAASLIPQQVKAMGGNLREFYTAIIEEAFN